MALIGRDTVEIAIGATRCTHRRIDHAPQPNGCPSIARPCWRWSMASARRTPSSGSACGSWAAREFLEMLVHRCGANATGWYRPVLQLYTLWDEHGSEALTAALAICHKQRDWTVPGVVRALKPQVAALAGAVGEAQS